jgi:hypothetical protein
MKNMKKGNLKQYARKREKVDDTFPFRKMVNNFPQLKMGNICGLRRLPVGFAAIRGTDPCAGR